VRPSEFQTTARAGEERILLCMAISAMPEPPVPARKCRCDLCGAAVWVARSSPRNVQRLCLRCLELEHGPLDKIADRVAPLNDAQVAEVLAYWKRRQS
jgi:hypothetical protein